MGSKMGDFWEKYSGGIVAGIVGAALIAMSGWAVEMDRQNTRITLILETMSKTMSRLELQLAEYKGLNTRVIRLEEKHKHDDHE